VSKISPMLDFPMIPTVAVAASGRTVAAVGLQRRELRPDSASARNHYLGDAVQRAAVQRDLTA